MKGKKRILNKDIRASKVQLIKEDGENLGIMSIDDAREIAKKEGLDLMEMGKREDATIVKMLDFWKFLYKQKKQEQKQKQQWKSPDMKTLRISFKISEHDLAVKRRQAEKFAAWGHALRVVLMLRWRENHYASIASEKINNFVESLEEIYKVENEVKKSGNTFSVLLKAKK